MKTAETIINLAKSWVGLNEKDGSYKKIIDIYNSQKGPFPRGLKMQYSWPWCACTISALAITLGYEDIIPIEISCGEMIKKAQIMGNWMESDDFTPLPGCIVLYDWDDSGKGDNVGWPDHVGIIESVNEDSGYFVVIEGNYNDSVKRRTVSINGKYIRGFIIPAYDTVSDKPIESIDVGQGNKTTREVAMEVIAGKWGSGEDRKKALTQAGYSYQEVQDQVNAILNGSAVLPKQPEQSQEQPVEKYVKATCAAKFADWGLSGTYKTTANLYCRNDAGTNKKALCKIPSGTKVENYGFYSMANNVKWLYIQFVMDGVQYTGFSSINYLKKV